MFEKLKQITAQTSDCFSELRVKKEVVERVFYPLLRGRGFEWLIPYLAYQVMVASKLEYNGGSSPALKSLSLPVGSLQSTARNMNATLPLGQTGLLLRNLN